MLQFSKLSLPEIFSSLLMQTKKRYTNFLAHYLRLEMLSITCREREAEFLLVLIIT